MAFKCVMAVYDSAAQVYGQPFFVPAIAAAVRSVGDETNRAAADNSLYQHPDDFELFHIGSYDDLLGVLQPLVPIVRVCRLKDLVQAVPSRPGQLPLGGV